ncbi:TPA: type II holin [Yersinia enterocolitica]|uniref:phage holin family protein n=1 Tax=Yersinia enterocolitica TaxID=630 RepID=UPI0037DE1BF8
MLSLDFNNEIVKAAPIAGAVGIDGVARVFYDMTLNEWFYVAAASSVSLHIVFAAQN